MCAISPFLAQGRESPRERANRGKNAPCEPEIEGQSLAGPVPEFCGMTSPGYPVAGIAGRAAGAIWLTPAGRGAAPFSNKHDPSPPKPAMTDEKPAIPPHPLRGDNARRHRLGAKLRENLKRRKSQIRERDRVSSDGHQDRPDGEVGKTDA